MANQIDQVLALMAAYGATNTDAGNQARAQAQALLNNVVQNIRPFLRASEAQVAVTVSELTRLRDEVKELVTEAQAAQTALRTG